MRKIRTSIAVLILFAITGVGCQALSNGIAKKTSCCDKLVSTCTGSKIISEDEETSGSSYSTTGSSNDILHNLPFLTIAE
ncbi:MAG: hypothetical protein V4722_25925 [Bacteroidota bacterium]